MFYFDFQEAKKQGMEPFIRSLIRQLLAVDEYIPQFLVTMYKQFRSKGQSPSLRDYESVLKRILEGSKKETFIVLDALDEYPQSTSSSTRREVTKLLTALVKEHKSSLHLLVTSRDETDIRDAFEQVSLHSVCLEAAKVDSDILKYVRSCLADDDRFSDSTQSLKDEIEQVVGRGAQGMSVHSVLIGG
jgi:hypothetical protein